MVASRSGFGESMDRAVPCAASTAVSAKAKAAERVALRAIEPAVDFMSCFSFFITASYRLRAVKGG
jgi:hypothetical protein